MVQAESPTYDSVAIEEKRQADLDIAEVGRAAKLPGEVDGRDGHARDFGDRNFPSEVASLAKAL
ncbi:MAG: hypothetical protein NTY19_09355 [Planctomycetota bacterium]|nr:hypothetical protein [Planctomycetota bacterium]